MEDLRELHKISSYKPTQGNLLRLFKMIAHSPEMNRESIRTTFIQNKSDASFRMVYKDLKDNLLDGIFTNSFPKYTNVQRAHISIYKYYAGAKILITGQNKKSGITFVKEGFRKALKYGILEVAESLCRELQNQYATVETNTNKHDYYRTEKYRIQALRAQEIEAEDALFGLTLAINTDKSVQKFHSIFQDLETINNGEYRFNLYKYTGAVLLGTVEGDGKKIIQTCRKAIKFFNETKTPLTPIIKWNFYFRATPILIAQREYSTANAYLSQSALAPIDGSYNQHLTLLYMSVLGFHSGKPKISFQAWKQSKKHVRKFDSPVITERWKVIEAYLHFFAKKGVLKMPTSFRLGKFLNETIKSSQRKPGQNVAILIVQMLHFLMDGKHTQYMRKANNLNQYLHEHLKGAAYKRSRLFLKMLQQVEMGDYQKSRVEELAKKYLVELKNTDIAIGVDLLENEVVRYEVIWAEVIDLLANKK